MDIKTYLSELEYLVNTDSGSEYPEGLNRVAEFFSTRFRDMGWNVEEHDLAPKSGTLLICTNRKAEHYDLLLIGHMDTVFPVGTAAQRPFTIQGNMAYGPGVSDMKHGCLMMYHLLKNLPAELNEKLNIVAVFNPDEEIGSVHSKDIYLPYARISDYAFLYEARAASGAYCVRRKGSSQFGVRFTGVQGHCGFVFENGARSAISEMARWIVALDALQSEERNTSVNIGVCSGGIKPNVVAAEATMTVDIRFSLPEEYDRVEQTLGVLMAQAKENGIGIELLNKRAKPAWNPDEKALAYLDHITALGKAAGFDPKFAGRGGLSDANYISVCGPICIDGLGPSGGDGHSVKEYMMLDTIEEVYNFSNLLFRDLADHKG